MPLYNNAVRDNRVREYLPSMRLVASDGVDAPEQLVGRTEYQSTNVIKKEECCILSPGAYILLDFGRELHGGIRITTAGFPGVGRVRVRFGESVSEAISTPNQDHSTHDMELRLPPMGCFDFGSTGFRFVRIDGIEGDIPILAVVAVAVYRDLERVGSFTCSDERLNRIWETGLYTVQLCMQDYIYDGIKRDRLVWLGDLNPEIRVILSVFKDTSIVKSSLDYMKDRTPLPKFMNSMLSYSCWWIINQYEYYLHTGDMEYLSRQHDYLSDLLKMLSSMVCKDGTLDTKGNRLFLDWPSTVSQEAMAAGGQGLFLWTFKTAALLAEFLHDTKMASLAKRTAKLIGKQIPDCKDNKSAAAIQTISGLCDRSDVLLAKHTKGVSTFFGYYMLLGQPVSDAVKLIRKYWGAMLDFGATTFWEDFNLDWTKNAFGIDQMPVPGKKDIHADFGNFCYKGLRHSLCHGWAGGPTAYLMEKVLGVRATAPGCAAISFNPNLCGLKFAKGTFPTPHGTISVSLEKGRKPIIEVPSGVLLEKM